MKIILPTLLAGSTMASIVIPSEDLDNSGVNGDKAEGKRISLSQRNFMAASLVELYPHLEDEGPNLNRLVNRVMRQYGCNCYPKSGKGAGLHQLKLGGTPIDDTDAVCAKYARVFSCITADSGTALVDNYNDYPENHYQVNGKDGGNEVDPSLTVAPDGPSINLDGNPHKIVEECGQWSSFEYHLDPQDSVQCGPDPREDYDGAYVNKPDNYCPKMVCEVAQAFVDELVQAQPQGSIRFTDPKRYWSLNKDTEDNLYKAECELTGGAVQGCCGIYPRDRSPVVVGKQKCCNVGTPDERKVAFGETC